jgi:hypothetical protein
MIIGRGTACVEGESRLILDGAASHAPIFGRHDHMRD